MDIKALQLASRFALAPNSLGFCGKDSAPEKFKKCIISGKCEGVEEEVGKFTVLNPFLKTIAKITSRPIFSYPVIESYWLGNDELKKATLSDYDLLLENFAKQGVPDFFLEEMSKKRPKVFVPNHLFQVLHIGVVKSNAVEPFDLESINNCIIRWGEVCEIMEDKSLINLHTLQYKNKIFKLKLNKEVVHFKPKLLPGLKVGDIVACHWNVISKKLTKKEVDNLEYWTKQVLAIFH